MDVSVSAGNPAATIATLTVADALLLMLRRL